jgi:hypothetical protein
MTLYKVFNTWEFSYRCKLSISNRQISTSLTVKLTNIFVRLNALTKLFIDCFSITGLQQLERRKFTIAEATGFCD